MTATNLPLAVFLMGPTASGKTALGVQLAQRLNGEVISVDSALVYRGMDIGTAKPSLDERQGVTHHLIDIIEPTDAFSAGQFREQSLSLIKQIVERGKTPILVGGTMLYFHVLLNGMAVLPNADVAIRKELDQQAQVDGGLAMHQRLMSIDPVAAKRIHPNDPQRIQRALEVYLSSGRTQTDWLSEQPPVMLPFKAHKFSISPDDREQLHKNIALRFDQMLAQGFVDEVKGLFERKDLNASMPSIRAVGYRQAWSYLDGLYDKITFREKAIIATRQLAKRQFTWLRKQSNIQNLETGDAMALDKVLRALDN